MKCEASIIVDDCNEQEISQIKKLFQTGDKEISNGRAEYKINEENSKIIFTIKAQDAVAFRAITTAITKNLSIFEKTKKIINQSNK